MFHSSVSLPLQPAATWFDFQPLVKTILGTSPGYGKRDTKLISCVVAAVVVVVFLLLLPTV